MIKGSMKYISKYTGVIAVALLWLAVIDGMFRTNLNILDDRPISFLGVESSTALFFNSLLFVSAVLFSIFGLHLFKKFNSSKLFLGSYLIGQFAQIVAGLFQYGGSEKTIHTVAAFTLAAAIPTHMLLFALSISKDHQYLKRIVYKFYIAELAFFTVGITAFIFANGVSPLAEILPALPFHFWVFYLTFFVREEG